MSLKRKISNFHEAKLVRSFVSSSFFTLKSVFFLIRFYVGLTEEFSDLVTLRILCLNLTLISTRSIHLRANGSKILDIFITKGNAQTEASG